MSKQTRNSNFRSTAATVVKATGVQEDGVGTTSTTSDPSGLRAPDGTNTPQSSGDAAGKASVDLVKPQAESDQTKTTLVEAENQTPAPVVEAAASGDLPKDDETVDGTGANAGSGLPVFDLSSVLVLTGTASLEHLIRVSAIGKQTLSVIEDVSAIYPRFQKWIGDDNPAEIIAELAEELADTKALSNGFSSFKPTRADADTLIEHLEPGDRHPLTKALFEHWDESRSPVIRITSKEAGFFRGGIRHPAEATDYPIETLSPGQLETILGETLLIVELV